MSLAVQEILFFRQLLEEFGFSQEKRTPLLLDNRGALDLAVSTKNHLRVQHIAIRFHFIREEVKNGSVSLKFVPTDDQTADIVTKPLGFPKFSVFNKSLNLQNWRGVGK